MNNYIEVETNTRNRSGLIKKLLVSLLIILTVLLVLLWFFPTKKSLDPLMQDIFRKNITTMQDSAKTYFTNKRLPKKVGDSVKLTLQEMLDLKLILPFVDKNGKSCNVNSSYVEITMEEDEYVLKTNLVCGDEEAYIIEYIGCTDICAMLGKCDETCSGASCEDKKITEYQFKREVANKVVSSYSCPSGYTYNKSSKLCEKTVTTTLKKDATPVYENKTTTTDRTYENKEVKKYLYKYQKEVITTTEVPDKTQPIRHYTYDDVIGSYTKKVCTGYNYFIDSSTNTLYQSSGDYKYSHTTTVEVIPKDTTTTHYEVIGMDYDKCMETCTLKPYYKVKVYTRSVSTISDSEYKNLSVTCKTEEKEVPIYGLKITFAGFVTDKVTSTEVKTEWSESKTDEKLIADNYGYVGVRKANGTTTEKVYGSCPTGTKVSDKDESKCVKTTTELVKYTCPSGYTLNSKKCTKTVKEVQTKKATANYKSTTGVEYKWSTSKTLEGWTATGKTREK